jgi:SHS2 domain-containing protein
VEVCDYFRYLEHTADVYVEVCAKTLERAFELAAKAMFEVMTDTSRVEPVREYVVEDRGFDLENALYRWLEDLLVEYGRFNTVFSEFRVDYVRTEEGGYAFRGRALGEVFNSEKHEPRVEVKAVTYSQMEVLNLGDRWILRFVLDI